MQAKTSIDLSGITTDLLKAILNSLRHRGVAAPISQPRSQPKRLSTKRRTETESRIDYAFEQTQSEKMWNNPATGPGGVVGGMFAFVHNSKAEGNICELHEITNVLDPRHGRPHWLSRHSTRNVLMLGPQIGTITFEQWKTLCVTGGQEPRPFKKTLKRLAGTKVMNWNPDLEILIQNELAKRDGKTSNALARIWTEEKFPLDMQIFAIVEKHAGKEGEPFFSNQVRGAAITIQMLLDPESYGRGICGANLQSGKTGIQVLVAAAFRECAIAKGAATDADLFGIIHVLNISDNDIKTQTKTALAKKFTYQRDIGLHKCDSDFNVLLHPEMLSSKAQDRMEQASTELADAGGTKFLVISDETQCAVNPEQQLGSFLRAQFGISSGVASRNTWMLGVTATPGRFYAPLSDGHPVTLCWIKSGPVYFGLDDLMKSGRIREIGEIKSVAYLQEILGDAMGNNNDKYVIIRTNPRSKLKDDQTKTVEAAWNEVLEANGYYVEQFNSSNDNIAEISETISKPPSVRYTSSKKVALMIKGAIRAGVTLETVEHVGAAFDCYSGDDAVVQSLVGRFCGNQPDRKDGPIIYTKKFKVEDYLADRAMIESGALPPARSKNGKAPTLTFIDAPAIICVAEDSKEVKDHATHLQSLGAKQKRNTFTENKRNYASEMLGGIWSQPERIFTLGTGQHKHHEIQRLVRDYPDLEKGFVLIATNSVREAPRPKATTLMNKRPQVT